MKTINEVRLRARLGKDAELKRFDAGSMCKLIAATANNYKSKATGEMVNEVQWHTIIIKGYHAAKAGKFRKGDMIDLTGFLKTRVTEHEGIKKYAVEIHSFDATLVEEGQQHEAPGEKNYNVADDWNR